MKKNKKSSSKQNATLAMSERKESAPETNMAIPSTEAIKRAKKWVDKHEV
ncbi:MAG: DUF3787 domain-containing protein [Clostridia bacterium]